MKKQVSKKKINDDQAKPDELFILIRRDVKEERSGFIKKVGNMTYKVDKNYLSRKIKKLKSNRGYLFAGSPKFLGLFGRDSLISAWQLLDYDPLIARDTLIALAKIQGMHTVEETREEPGKIIHEYYAEDETSTVWFNKYKAPVGWLKIGRAEYLAVDTTPLFIIILAKYYEKTGDRDTLERLWQNANMAIDWILNAGMMDKFLRYVPKEDKLKSQSWKDGIGKLLDDAISPVAVVEVQGYAYKAMKDMIWLMHEMGHTENIALLEEKAALLKKNFRESFWMEDAQYYALAMAGNGTRINAITSNPGHLLFTGILEKDEMDKVVKRLFMDDMFTPYGIRTHSLIDPNFDLFAYQLGSVWPHDNWIIAQGLKSDYKNEYDRVKMAIIRAAQELKSVPEYYGVSTENELIPLGYMKSRPCDPQAWSLGALVNMLNER
jgi:glycogen debranching enzyme